MNKQYTNNEEMPEENYKKYGIATFTMQPKGTKAKLKKEAEAKIKASFGYSIPIVLIITIVIYFVSKVWLIDWLK